MRWTRFDWLALLGLGMVALIYFAPAILYGQTFYFHDISIDYVPLNAFNSQTLREGELPLWTPYLNGGFPFAAQPESAPLYPLNLIFLLPLSLPTTLTWYLVAHYLLVGGFTYLLVRCGLHLEPLPAFLAGLVFAFNGMMIAQLTNFTLVVTLTWTPLILFLYIRAVESGKMSYTIGAGVVMAVQISKSHPQIVLYTAGLLAFYALFAVVRANWRAGWSYRSLAPFAALGLVFAVSAGLAAYQLLYTFELIQQSDRAGGLSYDKMTILSYPPFYLIKFLIPNFFGSFRHYAGNGNFPEMHAYVGILPLLLVPFAWLSPQGQRGSSRPGQGRVWFFAVLMLVCLGLSFGRFNPLYSLLQTLPLFSYFRVPARWLLLVAFCLAVLAAYGAQALIDWERGGLAVRPSWRRLILPVAIVLILGLLVWGGLSAWRSLRHLPINYRTIFTRGLNDPQLLIGYSWLMENDPGERDYVLVEPKSTNNAAAEWQRQQEAFQERVRDAYKDMRQSLTLFGLMLLLAVVLLAARWWGWLNGPLFGGLAAVLVLADLLTYGGISLNPTTEAAYFLDRPDTVQFLQQAEPNEPYRIFPTITWVPNPANTGYVLSTLHYNFPALYGIESIEGGATLPLQRHTAYMQRAVGQAGGLQLLSIANVKYIVTEWDLDGNPDLELVFTGQRQKIYRNVRALPRAFMVYRAEVRGEAAAILERLADPAFIPAETIILEEQPRQALPATPPEALPSVRVISYRHNRVTLEVETAANGLLFLGDVSYPGWKAYIDGQAAPIYQADYLFRAVEVEPGRHTVEFRYEPLSFRVGLAISLVTLLVLALAWTLHARKRLSRA